MSARLAPEQSGSRQKTRAVYASTTCIRDQFRSLEEQLESYARHGIGAVELGWAPRARGSDVAQIVRQHGFMCLVHNYFPAPDTPFVLNLASLDAVVLGKSRALARSSLRLCAALGAPFYSVHAGFRGDFSPESLSDILEFRSIAGYVEAIAVYRESIVALAAEGRSLGVGVLIEPTVVERRNMIDGRNQLLLLTTPDEITAFLSELREPNVGILLDTGHLNVTAHSLDIDRKVFVDGVAPWIKAFHVHDNDGSGDSHEPLRDGSWALEVLNDSRFRSLPAVTESRFPSVRELAAYVDWLQSRIT